MRFCLMVTGPAYGTQNASSAWLFANAIIANNHTLDSIFFYSEGVMNANALHCPASDEVNLTNLWQKLHQKHGVLLNICVSAALRRGVCNQQESLALGLGKDNLATGFQLTGLVSLVEAVLTSDRIVKF
ncbi:sulfurtransferase complex subunit TusD [Candidatus Erwinia haradaeae]|uniref:Sulfurtransferase TusD n=1 Tax=Candidatus Erwinia haradaeae TaxID=1922217 RepID=A0A451D404_9GAMM|nr:sulfurtransferase complex subunit TusD [Candidatus Erwinia haradaeae]VFP80380.1 Sulfurtransferase TusD [Candidatus Erwinia haradaeae]